MDHFGDYLGRRGLGGWVGACLCKLNLQVFRFLVSILNLCSGFLVLSVCSFQLLLYSPLIFSSTAPLYCTPWHHPSGVPICWKILRSLLYWFEPHLFDGSLLFSTFIAACATALFKLSQGSFSDDSLLLSPSITACLCRPALSWASAL